MQTRQIGLLGAGNMAGALLRGLLASGAVAADRVRASDVRADRLQELERDHGIVTHGSNLDLVRWADVLVLAVKPQVLGAVLDEAGSLVTSETLVISVAAGVPCAFVESRLRAGIRVVRAMPNTPALVQCGASALFATAKVSEEQREQAESLMRAHIGRATATLLAHIDPTKRIDPPFQDSDTAVSGGHEIEPR